MISAKEFELLQFDVNCAKETLTAIISMLQYKQDCHTSLKIVRHGLDRAIEDLQKTRCKVNHILGVYENDFASDSEEQTT